jgi:hypothetical protein
MIGNSPWLIILLVEGRRSMTKGCCVFSVHEDHRTDAFGALDVFRREFHRCLTARRDALFELTDALLCTDGPVRTLVG